MSRRSLLLFAVALASCGRTPVTTPAAAPAVMAVPARPAWVARKVVPNAVERAAGTITVAAGEGWSHLAARSGVPAGALYAANGLSPTAPLVAGQVLKVPAGRIHTVAAGETGIAIARAYGVAWREVAAANRLVPPYTLEIGDKILLPVKQAVAAMSVEERARAFRIDIEDLITGAEPAVTAKVKPPARSRSTPPAPIARADTPSDPRPLPLPTGGSPVFAWPVEGRVLSAFGAKPGGRYNDGVNLKASAGSAVRAAADGVVAYAGDAVAGFGNLILIKHADGWVTAYGHNEALLVARGARVRRGNVIARAGATGAVDEPQVHFELRRGRVAVDPVKLLPARN